MLEERDIIRHCESRMLRRARNIAGTDDAIFDKRCAYDTGERPLTRLRAKVKSTADWRTNYDVELSVDEDAGRVVDYGCTCASSLSSPGMCKHVAAAALVFLEAPASFNGHMSIRTTQSSNGIKKTLKDMERDHAVGKASKNEETLEGVIDVEPCLICIKDGWGLRLSVSSIDGQYVVKDIPKFLDTYRQRAFFTYGERLAFTHEPNVFTEHAKRVISFIERCIDIREQLTSDALNSYKASQGELRGGMYLSVPEIVEFLHICGDTTFHVDDCTKIDHKPVRTHVIEGDPPLRMRIEKQGSGGYVLFSDVNVRIISYGQEVYAWSENLFFECDPKFSECLSFITNVYGNKAEQAYLSSGDSKTFCKTVLPSIEQFIEIELPNDLEMLRPRSCEIEVYLDREGSACICQAYAVYDDERLPLIEADGSQHALSFGLRDEELEHRATRTLNKYFPIVNGKSSSDAEHGLRITADEDIAKVLSVGLEDMSALGTLFTTPAFETFMSNRKPKVVFGLSIKANLVDLNASVEDLPKSELAALINSYKLRKRFHRLSDGSFLDLSSNDWSKVEEYSTELGVDMDALLIHGAQLPMYRAFQLDGLVENAKKDTLFTEYVSSIENECDRDMGTPSGFAGELRPYQIEGLSWLCSISAKGLGGILADEMGLGKTIQLIAYVMTHLDESRAYGPSLIVCPASVVYNWTAEFERFAPSINVTAVAGSKEERQAMLEDCADAARGNDPCDVMITSYDLLRRDVDLYEEMDFFMVALDEAQYIKNHATISARSVKSLDALHRFALTGTPIENRLSELWSIFDFLMPGLLGTYDSFRSKYEQPILDGDERALERLQALVSHFILRRMKDDVLTDLPDKNESIVYSQLGDEQVRLYRALEQRLRESINSRTKQAFSADKIAVLAEITRLRELCCDPSLLYEDYDGGSAKLDTILDLISSANDSDEKTLVFSQFVQFLDIIATRLDLLGIPYYVITGSTPKRQRIKLVNDFNEDATPVFLVSLKAGGTGLNLTGASVVIHSDPWWNLAAENQATDRAHRIGQKSAVSVYKVIAKGTIEERVVDLQLMKSKLADKLIRGDGTPLATLTQDELLKLLER